MTDPSIGTVIVRHIDELEAALRYASGTMQPMLAKAVAAMLEERRIALGWAGEAVADLTETLWMAPREWKMAGDPGDDDFDLSFSLGTMPCIDGHEPETWVGTIAGFAGAGIRFVFGTDAIGQRDWKALLRSEGALLDELINRGFLCDPKTGDLALTIPINREALASGFEEEDLETALMPLRTSVDRIHEARPIFDRLVEVIRKKGRP